MSFGQANRVLCYYSCAHTPTHTNTHSSTYNFNYIVAACAGKIEKYICAYISATKSSTKCIIQFYAPLNFLMNYRSAENFELVLCNCISITFSAAFDFAQLSVCVCVCVPSRYAMQLCPSFHFISFRFISFRLVQLMSNLIAGLQKYLCKVWIFFPNWTYKIPKKHRNIYMEYLITDNTC